MAISPFRLMFESGGPIAATLYYTTFVKGVQARFSANQKAPARGALKYTTAPFAEAANDAPRAENMLLHHPTIQISHFSQVRSESEHPV